MRELTGYTAHKTADDAAYKGADCGANALKELSALADEPGQARNLCQTTDSGEHKCQFGDNCAHAKNTSHSAGNQPGDSAKCQHDSGQQTDAGDAFQQRIGINTGQSIHDPGEERHEEMHSSLNQIGQISRNALDDLYQELSNGIDNLRGVCDQSRQYAGNQLQRSVCQSRNTLD